MKEYPIVRLRVRRNVPYPLVWRRTIAEAPHAAAGDCVTVLDKEGAFVGRGFFSPTSEVAVRLLSHDPAGAIDDGFLATRLSAAFSMRHGPLGLGKEKDSGYRLCNAEGDGLSGLILDRYADLIVGELHSIGYFCRLSSLRRVLAREFPGFALYFRADDEIQRKEGFRLEAAAPDPVQVAEHDLRYLVDPGVGHKTGFFLDQRENRLRLRPLAEGRRVLDLCCFTGGFALNAAQAGAREVTGIDLDEKAIALASKNAARNRLKARFVHADAFPYLRDMARGGKTVDLAILDPPKLARNRGKLEEALRTHFDFHRAVLPVLAPNGMLVTCSCSALVSEEAFLSTLGKAGRRMGREVRVFSITGPSPDHPYSLHFPEGRYLKVVWASV